MHSREHCREFNSFKWAYAMGAAPAKGWQGSHRPKVVKKFFLAVFLLFSTSFALHLSSGLQCLFEGSEEALNRSATRTEGWPWSSTPLKAVQQVAVEKVKLQTSHITAPVPPLDESKMKPNGYNACCRNACTGPVCFTSAWQSLKLTSIILSDLQ